jgi:hypothetical protein
MKDISVCGIDCAVACIECNKYDALKNNPCRGCNAIEGKVFWTKMFKLDTCPIYSCVKEKQFAHCGECAEMPCNIYYEMRDPTVSDERHEEGLRERMEVLKSL